MLRYMFLLSTYILRKWALIIISVIGLLVTFLVFWSMIASNVSYGTSALDKLPSFMYMVPFMFTSLFSVFVYNYAFKDGEKDGSELIILTKPVSRIQIFFSKIIILIVYMVIHSIFYLIMFSILAVKDDYVSSSVKNGFIWSGWFGVLVVQILFAPLMILIGTLVGKIGVLVITIFMTALFPVSSIILAPIATNSNALYDLDIDGGSSGVESYKVFDLSTIQLDASNNYGVPNKTIDVDKDSYFYIKNDGEFVNGNFVPYLINSYDGKYYPTQKYDEYVEGVWYDTYAYFDVWYQWSRFYSIFVKQNTVQSNDFKMVKKLNNRVSGSNESGIEVIENGKSVNYLIQFTNTRFNTINDYFFNSQIWTPSSYNNSGLVKTTNSAVVAPHLESIWGIFDNTSNFNLYFAQPSLANRIALLIDMVNYLNKNYDTDYNMSNAIESIKYGNFYDHDYHFETAVMLYKLIEKKYGSTPGYTKPTTVHFTKKVMSASGSSVVDSNILSERFIPNNSSISNEYLYAVQLDDFIDTWAVVLIWILLGIALYGLSFWRYTRIDFK